MKWILESPGKPYFIEYRGDWELRILHPEPQTVKSIESIAKHYMKQLHVINLSSEFDNWCKFVYVHIPNNWLKMHGYPKRHRSKTHGTH